MAGQWPTSSRVHWQQVLYGDHALSGNTGGYPSLRNYKLQDLYAGLMKEVCSDLEVEPCLQPLTGESLHFRSAIREDEFCLDIRTGFWGSEI